jgi:hypothetical protein
MLQKEVNEHVNNFKKSVGLPSQQERKSQQTQQHSEGQTGTYKGQPVVWQNGKWNKK